MLKYLRIVVVLFVLVSISAWQTDCELEKISGIQANKKKKIVFNHPIVYGEYFEYHDSTGTYVIREYHRPGEDSVVIYRGYELISKFMVENDQIIDDKLIEYREGKIYKEDSLTRNIFNGSYYSLRYRNRYYYNSIWQKSYWSSGRMKTLTYNGRGYRDSFFQSWFENGLTSQVKTKSFQLDYYPEGNARRVQYFSRYGRKDSFVQEWYPNGVVSNIKNNGFQYLYYENGVIKQIYNTLNYLSYNGNEPINNTHISRKISFSPEGILQEFSTDTVINANWVNCIKTYSQKGILQSVKYFLSDDLQPCHIWTDYNPEGLLVKTVQKSFLKRPPNPRAPAGIVDNIVMDENIYMEVTQDAYFIGGVHNSFQYHDLLEYLDLHFLDLDKKILKKLDGHYEITFKVEKDRRVIFTGLKGHETALIKEKVKKIIEGMKWIPAKENGKDHAVEMMLRFEVIED